MGYKCQICSSKSGEPRECCGAPMVKEEEGEKEGNEETSEEE